MDFEKMAREIAHRMLFGGPLDEWEARYPNRPDWQAHAEAAEAMLRAAFAAGREAMREDVAEASQQRVDQWREMGALRAADAGDAILSIIRALTGKGR